MHHRKANTHDYKLIMKIWSKSVEATHAFVRREDLQQISKEIPAYLPHLDVQLWYEDNVCIGFSGVHGQHLEMLFLDPSWIGKGLGTRIMEHLVHKAGVTSVDVNKDNGSAALFYQKNGFVVSGESSTDGEGRAYPILHMTRTKDES